MTYRELITKLQGTEDWDEKALDKDVSVVLLHTGEVVPALSVVISWDYAVQKELDIVDGVLDEEHPFIVVDF